MLKYFVVLILSKMSLHEEFDMNENNQVFGIGLVYERENNIVDNDPNVRQNNGNNINFLESDQNRDGPFKRNV